MANPRKDLSPYGNFNFLVKLADSMTVNAGFQEVSGINIEVTSAEYRAGNSPVNHPIKRNGPYKVGDVTLKRGAIGATDLYTLIDGIRTGHPNPQNVQVVMQDEAHSTDPVLTITLINARPTRYTAPTFNAKSGTDVGIEELVLSCEDLTIE
jgi:phage tail-like protein